MPNSSPLEKKQQSVLPILLLLILVIMWSQKTMKAYLPLCPEVRRVPLMFTTKISE
uniref:Uncharacterized protein n=1 Tax=Rhizophora mucronata TaxID=61149 RepID=A0A2P2NQ39_RHIMU